jgi:hypothetical protein
MYQMNWYFWKVIAVFSHNMLATVMTLLILLEVWITEIAEVAYRKRLGDNFATKNPVQSKSLACLLYLYRHVLLD